VFALSALLALLALLALFAFGTWPSVDSLIQAPVIGLVSAFRTC
jgi:hypothetical protein